MSITKAIRDFMLTCPYIEVGTNVNVDFVASNNIGYTISRTSCAPIVKQYIDGGALQQYQFTLTSKNTLGEDTDINIKNNDFYEKLEKWIQVQNELEYLPILDNGTAQKIEITKSGSLVKKEGDKASYQIQLTLLYER